MSPLVDRVLDTREATLLDLVDRLLSKGVLASGDLTLGVAGIDLIYVRLSALICAAERALPSHAGRVPARRARGGIARRLTDTASRRMAGARRRTHRVVRSTRKRR